MIDACISTGDTATVNMSPTSGLVIREDNGTAAFTFALNSRPASVVTIGITSGNLAEGTVSPPSLTFVPGNWADAQSVTVTGVDDDSVNGDVTLSIRTTSLGSDDSNFHDQTVADISVTILNTDGKTETQMATFKR
jgi:hypothetical protein